MKSNKPEKASATNTNLPRCGIIMPISPIDGCGAEHWLEILSILKEVAVESGFEPNLVSDADDIGIIQKRIIQNVYNSDIIICDVSCKNPNVMFELGLRLAFDKATVIIKDDKTDYSFDTGVIEHIGYPRDLRFHKILEFKENLQKKLVSTYKKSKEDANYSTFLKNFGEYKVAHLNDKEVSSEKYILDALEELKTEVRRSRIRSLSYEDYPVRRTSEAVNTSDYIRRLISRYYQELMHDGKIKRETDINSLKRQIFEKIQSSHDYGLFKNDEELLRALIDKVVS